MSTAELVVLGLVVIVAVVVVAALGPHFMRGFRDAREQRGVDLNMQHRAEQELAEEELEDAEWRRRIDADLDDQVERWREDQT
ncbi:MAG: hypothetical protein R3343_04695 [Nitriliruptorales bacterium]|nr:hypothetical protein [Nitriliruptorales bacterium]